MRKVIYTEWVHGTSVESSGIGFANNKGYCIEKEGLFHGFFPTAMENNDGSLVNYTSAFVECEDGSILSALPTLIRFVDKPEEKPEADQLAEFAKAAMVGLLSNTEIVNHFDGGSILWISKHAVLQAKSLIAELNKQK